MPRFVGLQPEYNLVDRAGFESALEPPVRERGLGVITYYSFASGFLTRKYRSTANIGKSAARGGAMLRYLETRGLRVLEVLDDVASGHRATPAQVARAWLMARRRLPRRSPAPPPWRSCRSCSAQRCVSRDAVASVGGAATVLLRRRCQLARIKHAVMVGVLVAERGGE